MVRPLDDVPGETGMSWTPNEEQRAAIDARGRVFVSAGAGYVGAVHEGLTLLESGISFRGGGGLKYPLVMQRRGRIKGAGIRADAALVVMTSGLAAESGATRQLAATGSVYFSF